MVFKLFGSRHPERDQKFFAAHQANFDRKTVIFRLVEKNLRHPLNFWRHPKVPRHTVWKPLYHIGNYLAIIAVLDTKDTNENPLKDINSVNLWFFFTRVEIRPSGNDWSERHTVDRIVRQSSSLLDPLQNALCYSIVTRNCKRNLRSVRN